MAPDPNGFLFHRGDDISRIDSIQWEPKQMNDLMGGASATFTLGGMTARIERNVDGTLTKILQNGVRINQHEWNLPDNFVVTAVEKRDAGSRIEGVSEELAFIVEFQRPDGVHRFHHYVMAQRMRQWPQVHIDKVSTHVRDQGDEKAKRAWAEMLELFNRNNINNNNTI